MLKPAARFLPCFTLLLVTLLFFIYHFVTNSVPFQYENGTSTFQKVQIKAQKISRTLSQNRKCNDFDVVKEVKQKGNFYVLTNFVQSKKTFRCHESVTFASPADFTFLDNLETLVERWRAPVSVALYAPGYDFETTMDSINFLRGCKSPLIEDFVTFHLFFDENHMPNNTSNYSKSINCQADAPFITNQESYKTANNLTFPINIARNVAKEEAQTHFVMTADIELIPTPNFVEKFLEMVLKRPELFDDDVEGKNAFVLPIFEVPENELVPETKAQLKKMYAEKRAFVFHEKLCKICHKVPESDKWLAANETGSLDVIAMGKRQGRYRTWEPFYVATKEVPNFDERLTWEGQSNKMTQGYLMCVMDYNYLILNDAFLVHKPGIKKSKTQLKKYPQLVRDTNKMLKNTIKLEYDKIYGTRKGCFLS